MAAENEDNVHQQFTIEDLVQSTVRALSFQNELRLNASEIKNMISELNGVNDDVNNWFRRIETVRDNYQVDQKVLVITIIGKLTGRALDWFHSKPELVAVSYEELKLRMVEMYGQKERIFYSSSSDDESINNVTPPPIVVEVCNNVDNSGIVINTIDRIKREIFIKVTEEIIDLFPGEQRESYYTPYCSAKSGLRMLARGKLWSRYVNVKAALRIAFQSEMHSNRASCNKENTKPIEYQELTDETDSELMFLKTASEPQAKISKAWEVTCDRRYNLYYHNEKIDNLYNIFPCLKCSNELEVVSKILELDFNFMYPEKVNIIYETWPKVADAILSEAKVRKIDLPISTDTSTQALLILPFLFTPDNKIEKKTFAEENLVEKEATVENTAEEISAAKNTTGEKSTKGKITIEMPPEQQTSKDPILARLICGVNIYDFRLSLIHGTATDPVGIITILEMAFVGIQVADEDGARIALVHKD
ncbi:hypothetical protein RN001_005877 [Aquatica leii]|uniref:Uncharacterized protein n=1 Tax=Aquatica leii TaxID=1421715 RepID=A0AAN7QKM2_9COLE|nr:hypothetical protein RN001_005877 [Aquatica leii]